MIDLKAVDRHEKVCELLGLNTDHDFSHLEYPMVMKYLFVEFYQLLRTADHGVDNFDNFAEITVNNIDILLNTLFDDGF
jgi:hypothetical protein